LIAAPVGPVVSRCRPPIVAPQVLRHAALSPPAAPPPPTPFPRRSPAPAAGGGDVKDPAESAADCDMDDDEFENRFRSRHGPI